MSTYTYEIIAVAEGSLARCIELGTEAIGATRSEAVSALRGAVADKLSDSEAVAPAETPRIDFDLVEKARERVEPFGPGDTGRPSHEGSKS
jgi:hypothetical protein